MSDKTGESAVPCLEFPTFFRRKKEIVKIIENANRGGKTYLLCMQHAKSSPPQGKLGATRNKKQFVSIGISGELFNLPLGSVRLLSEHCFGQFCVSLAKPPLPLWGCCCAKSGRWFTARTKNKETATHSHLMSCVHQLRGGAERGRQTGNEHKRSSRINSKTTKNRDAPLLLQNHQRASLSRATTTEEAREKLQATPFFARFFFLFLPPSPPILKSSIIAARESENS